MKNCVKAEDFFFAKRGTAGLKLRLYTLHLQSNHSVSSNHDRLQMGLSYLILQKFIVLPTHREKLSWALTCGYCFGFLTKYNSR